MLAFIHDFSQELFCMVACEQHWVFQTLCETSLCCIIKMIIASFFLVLVLEYFELLWLSVVPQFLEVNKDLEGRWAHDGLRVMWLTGGRPGFWSPVFGLPGQCSVLRLPLLPQPPLRLRVKRCFSDNSSVLLCHPLPTEYFFFPVGVTNISKLQTLNMIEG